MQMINESGAQHCIRGERVENLYDRDVAEKAEINLLTKVGKSGVKSFSLAWLMIDRQWQIVAFSNASAPSDALDR